MEPSENQKKLIEFAFKRSVLRLETQQTFAVASDQRSLVFAGLSVAAAALIFQALEDTQAEFFGAGAAIFFLISAVVSSLSAIPQRLFTGGDTPENLRDNINLDDQFDLIVLGICDDNSKYILENENKAKLRSAVFKLGIWFFFLGATTATVGLIKLGGTV